ncbi:hypothetical protein KC726_05890 [Candidatus Woesebacteria bacterium]|nr:hypothetical protein [Candidatus Woesebacteria bacterium]
MNFQHFSTLLVSGSLAYDEIMNFPDTFKEYFDPEKLHQINISFVVNKLTKHLGGTATNIAYNASLYSKKNVAICGAFGKDHQTLSTFLKKHNIDLSHCHFDKALYTSTGRVITDSADNQIWGYYYGASEHADEIDLSFVDDSYFIVLSANHKHGFLAMQNYCITNQIPYLYDPGMTLTWIDDKDLLEGIQHAIFLVGNDYEMGRIYKRLSLVPGEVTKSGTILITTLGKEGAHFQSADETFSVAGYPVKQLVDPTGAGDAFRGGLISALREGASFREAVVVANAIASFVVESHGTVNHAPTRSAIAKRIQQLSIS